MPTPEARLATILDHAAAADPSGVLLYFHTPAEAEAFLADYTRRETEADKEIRRLRDAIVSARWRLAKGRGLWNGPCHECDAALERGLTGADIRSRASKAELAAMNAAGDAGLTIRNPAPDGTPPSMPTGRNATFTIQRGQTGGGDAGERAREDAGVIKAAQRVFDELAAGGFRVPDEAMLLLRTGIRAALREGAEEARQDALRAPFTKALVAEARTQGYQEGAEAMREADARVADSFTCGGCGMDGKAGAAIRVNPIPGKTDA